MPTLYLDFETSVSKTTNLKVQTLRQYLASARLLGVAYAVDDGVVEWTPADAEGRLPADLLADFRAVAESPDWTVVAHNAAFDIRVWRLCCGLPQPATVDCSLELACAAWPNQPGGYKLGSLAETLNLGFKKLGDGTKVMRMTPEELAAYCCADVELCRAIHKLALKRLHPQELAVARLTNQVRELYFEVDRERVDRAFTEFSKIAAESAVDALVALANSDDADDIKEAGKAFGWTGDEVGIGAVKSVKPHEMKRLLLDIHGFDTDTISYKKLNPEKLRAAPEAAVALKAAERTNKALSHKRRVNVFQGSTEVDCELGYFRAHTGRFSSPSVGRGLNLHNLSKRDKRIAKAIRSMFRLPQELCLVRGDEMNVEYRVEGLLTGCEHTHRLFSSNVLADPYSEFGYAATGVKCAKTDPIRQVWKAAVLGLGYMMGIQTWMLQLLGVLADYDTYKVKLKDLEDVCAAMRWGPPGDRWTLAAMAKVRAPWQVAAVAYHTRNLFHEVHPEFGKVTRWLVHAIAKLNQCRDEAQGLRMLDGLYRLPAAPSRDLIDLRWDTGFEGRTIRVRCGCWPAPTVTWRDIDVRALGHNGGMCMTYMNGRKGYWPLSPNVMIENIVQSAARNATCQASLALQERGYPYQFSIHDELLLAVPRDPVSVLAARADMLDVVGPNRLPGWKWAVGVNPNEINVSQSMYEVDVPPDFWSRLAAGDASPLEHLS